MVLKNKNILVGITVLILILVVPTLVITGCTPSDKKNTITIGTPNYSEVIVMGYVAKALIEDQTDYKVEVITGLTSGALLEKAMNTGDVDIASVFFIGGVNGITHPAYADEIDLEDPKWRDADYIWEFLHERAPAAQGFIWLPPLGWENTYAMTVNRELAEKYNLEKISDLRGISKGLTIGMEETYYDRQLDGYFPLLEYYGLERFNKEVSIDLNLLYKALKEKQVDVGMVYSTDPRITAYDLVWLEDDLNIFPPYHAGYCITLNALERAPEIEGILEKLSGKVNIDVVRQINYEVDINERDEGEVAKEFLQGIGLLSP